MISLYQFPLLIHVLSFDHDWACSYSYKCKEICFKLIQTMSIKDIFLCLSCCDFCMCTLCDQRETYLQFEYKKCTVTQMGKTPAPQLHMVMGTHARCRYHGEWWSFLGWSMVHGFRKKGVFFSFYPPWEKGGIIHNAKNIELIFHGCWEKRVSFTKCVMQKFLLIHPPWIFNGNVHTGHTY